MPKTKTYIIQLEYVKDGHKVLEWLKEAHFKTWFTIGTKIGHTTAQPFFIEVYDINNRFEPWFALKWEVETKKPANIKGGHTLFAKIS